MPRTDRETWPYPTPDGWWWVSSVRMTFAVCVREGRVREHAPIARRFVYQKFPLLLWWMHDQGGLQYAWMGPPDGPRPPTA